ncbi:hypothetical protein AHAS_Ahas17G0164400 [Arachis hypogaea]
MESSSRASARFIPVATVEPITLSRNEILKVTLELRSPLLDPSFTPDANPPTLSPLSLSMAWPSSSPCFTLKRSLPLSPSLILSEYGVRLLIFK